VIVVFPREPGADLLSTMLGFLCFTGFFFFFFLGFLCWWVVLVSLSSQLF